MEPASIELHVRREADLVTLRALKEALEREGETVTLTAAPGVSPMGAGLPQGPISCRVRVLVEGEAATPDIDAEHTVVIEDRLLPVAILGDMGASDVLARADLILVPGPSHVASFATDDCDRSSCNNVKMHLGTRAWFDPSVVRTPSRSP